MQNSEEQADHQPAIISNRKTLSQSRTITIEPLKFSDEKPTLVGRSQMTADLLARIEQIAKSNLSILVTGPTGSGKEVVARLIHERSSRGSKPFIAVNCAAIPENLLESELFGYEKGAFTGADVRKNGKWEAASGGTLLLDEIGESPRSFQSKILRILQDGIIPRLGSERFHASDVRVIAATNRDLETAVSSGEFREDLYYRLNVVRIDLPPLKEHKEDIPLLIEHFVSVTDNSKDKTLFSAEAISLLSLYDWPGNIRELRNVVIAAVNLHAGAMIELDDLPMRITSLRSTNHIQKNVATESKTYNSEETLIPRPYWAKPGRPLDNELNRFRSWLIENAINANGGNVAKAAKFLGLSKQALYKQRKRPIR